MRWICTWDRKHGKILEEGASGYLGKKLCTDDSKEATTEKSDVDWSSFNQIISVRSSEESTLFGSKSWASVYFASTPQQAAELGLKFPGVDEVRYIWIIVLLMIYNLTAWSV